MRTGRSPGAKPQPVITGADVDVGLDLVTTRATTGVEPMRVLGEAIAQVVTDSDHGRKPDALARIIGDGLFNRLAQRTTVPASAVTPSTPNPRRSGT